MQKLYPDAKFEIHTMTTVGDRVLNKSLPKIGEKSLFTKDLEDALRSGGVDFVVHSLKDLPTQLPNGMTIGAVLEREDPRDALVLNTKFLGKTLKTLPEGSLIGTSSLRRAAQLCRNFKHLKVCDIRGNLNTRLAKLDAPNSKFAGIILAYAGLVRMGWSKRVDQVIDPDELVYAIGQGALAVECRVNDPLILDMLSHLCDLKSQCRILVERSFLKTLGGGCSAPVAVCSNLAPIPENDGEYEMQVQGGVWSLNGDTEILDNISCTLKFNEEVKEKDEKADKDEDEVEVPSKKMKLDQPQEFNVVDDNFAGTPGKSQFKKLVKEHGKWFAKCPYSGQSIEITEEEKKKMVEEGHLDVSIGMPVGQDFMGECPAVSMDEKVHYEDDLMAAGDNPMVDLINSDKEAVQEKEQVEKCPFIMIDYEQEHKDAKETSVIDEKDTSIYLYCGMFARNEKIKQLFEKCEKLGIALADKLIADGALEVMHAAQNEIHSKM